MGNYNQPKPIRCNFLSKQLIKMQWLCQRFPCVFLKDHRANYISDKKVTVNRDSIIFLTVATHNFCTLLTMYDMVALTSAEEQVCMTRYWCSGNIWASNWKHRIYRVSVCFQNPKGRSQGNAKDFTKNCLKITHLNKLFSLHQGNPPPRTHLLPF